MNPRTSFPRARKALLAVCLAAFVPSVASADEPQRPRAFDFSDSYYRANGIEPSKLIIRPNGQDGVSVVDTSNTDPNRRNIRVKQVWPTYDNSGKLWFFYIFGLINPDGFTPNAAGTKAYGLAEKYNLYAFPRKANAPFVIFPKRQEDLSDLSNGYFSADPLGLWKTNLVRFTSAATQTSGGRAALAKLASRNGTDLDGTPIIKTQSDLFNLRDSGYVDIHPVATDGSEGEPWFACPMVTDPRNGAFAPDAFVEVVRYDDGSTNAEATRILSEFNCLKTTGNSCR